MENEALAKIEPQALTVTNDYKELYQLSTILIKSGLAPRSIRSPEQAFFVIMKGQEVGIPPIQALTHIHIIEGKPTMSAELMLALAKEKAGVHVESIELTNEKCRLRFTRPNRPEHTEEFTIEEAKLLGFVNKDNYKKQLGTMLRWRCISKGLRFYAPEALAGISYTPDELDPRITVDPDSGEPIGSAGNE